MSGSVNKVILIGNLGRDPEVRRLNSGDAVVNLNLATTESWRDKASGERKDKTEWHRVVIFNENLGKVAEAIPEEGLQGLYRGPASDAEIYRQGRRREVPDRGRSTALPRRIDPDG